MGEEREVVWEVIFVKGSIEGNHQLIWNLDYVLHPGPHKLSDEEMADYRIYIIITVLVQFVTYVSNGTTSMVRKGKSRRIPRRD